LRYCQTQHNFKCGKDLEKIKQKYSNALIYKFHSFFTENYETFDIRNTCIFSTNRREIINAEKKYSFLSHNVNVTKECSMNVLRYCSNYWCGVQTMYILPVRLISWKLWRTPISSSDFRYTESVQL